MSEETYEIQWLGNLPYLVYQNLNKSDDCIIIGLTKEQKQAVEEFEYKQWCEKRDFTQRLFKECNQ